MTEVFKKKAVIIFATVAMHLIAQIVSSGGVVFDQRLIDTALSGNFDGVVHIGVFRLVIALFDILIMTLTMVVDVCCTNSVIFEFRKKFFYTILNYGRKTVVEYDTADLMSRMVNDMEDFKNDYVGGVLFLLPWVFHIIFNAGLMFYYQPILAVIAIMLSLLMLIIPKIAAKKVGELKKARAESRTCFTEGIQDIFEGLEVVFNYNLKEKMKKRFDDLNSEMTKKDKKVDSFKAGIDICGQGFSVLGATVLLIAAAYLVYRGKLSIGGLAIYLGLKTGFMSSLQMLIRMWPLVKGTKCLYERLELPENDDAQNKPIPTFERGIRIENLSFGYNEEDSLFEKMSLKLDAGKKYGIIGKNGEGKTTLIKLLSGYLNNYSGKIMYDEKELRELNQERLNEICAIISQNTYLFNDSILENITLGESFENEKIEEVVKSCGIDKIRSDLNSKVGEKGGELSGGQRQRIAIARALIRETPLLIIDEGMNAIDEEGNSELWEYLLNNSRLTLFSVTHDLSKESMSRYDSVLSLENKTVAEIKMV